MSFFDPFLVGVASPVGTSATIEETQSRLTLLDKIISIVEKKPRNSIFVGYVWVGGVWEQTVLRRNIKQVEKQV